GNNLRWRLESARGTETSVDGAGLLEKGRGAAWCALVDGTELHCESDGIDGLRQLMTYRVFSTIAGNYRRLMWWSVFIVSAREVLWTSRNMSKAIRPLMVG